LFRFSLKGAGFAMANAGAEKVMVFMAFPPGFK
jgi:hypothetical protein